jgi:hypothetical protein
VVSGTVIGVVLNAIDDTLDAGKTGGPHWTVDEVTYLRPVLDEARRAGRPVILTADHGHVLDRGTPISAEAAESARWRSGKPGPGEIAVRGPRVLTLGTNTRAAAGGAAAEGTTAGGPATGEQVVAAVDEGIHYTPRKAGYHGGASPAEVVIPVITLLPSESLLPSGWYTYDHDGHAPAWWNAPARPAAPQPEPRLVAKPPTTRRKRPETPDGPTLFDTTEVAPSPAPGVPPSGVADSLGARVTASARMTAQRQFVRRAPDNASVARLIDTLTQAGGRLTVTEAAAAAGESPVRMSGYLAQIIRLLNVDGYAVLQTKDDGRTVKLNQELLRQQFLSG